MPEHAIFLKRTAIKTKTPQKGPGKLKLQISATLLWVMFLRKREASAVSPRQNLAVVDTKGGAPGLR